MPEPVVAEYLDRLIRDIDADAFLLRADGGDRPDLIVVDRKYGLITVDIEPRGTDPTARDAVTRLNRKIAELRVAAPTTREMRPHRLILLGGYSGRLLTAAGTGTPRAISPADLDFGGWLTYLDPRPVDSDDYDNVRAELAPALAFEEMRFRRGAADPGRVGRHQQRLVLDAQQAAAAIGHVKDVLAVSGPPGSGKTLVLAGRARFLAIEHPDWRIAFLCFNNALVPYLERLVAGCDNVEVSTFGKFAQKCGHRMALSGEAQAAADLRAARAHGIRESFDALLIDEAQDFMDAWLELALDTIRPGRGGVVLAGDPRQALYRDGDQPAMLSGRHVERMHLTHAYRSTASILRAAAAATPDNEIPDGVETLEGEPVALIYADSWAGQADAVAWEIRRMLDSGEREAQDIAVLVTQRSGTLRRLDEALQQAEVPYEVVGRGNQAALDLDTATVKVMTVHAAKGYEFDVVILFGLEALPKATCDDAEQAREVTRRGRVALVGMTRARDLLLITWTRNKNEYVERLASTDAVMRYVWPDDYEV